MQGVREGINETDHHDLKLQVSFFWPSNPARDRARKNFDVL